MWQTVYEYFILYKKLDLAGIGFFEIEPMVARLDLANKLLHAPLPVVRFSHENKAADKNFYQFLSHHTQRSETEVIRQYQDLCADIQQQIEAKGSVHLKGIGVLKKEFAKTYSFQPSNDTDRYFPDVKVERVLRYEQHTIRVGEDHRTNTEMEELLHTKQRNMSWEKMALILSGVAVAIILIYHLTR